MAISITQLMVIRTKKPIAPRIWKWKMLAIMANNEANPAKKKTRSQNHRWVIRKRAINAKTISTHSIRHYLTFVAHELDDVTVQQM